MNDFKLRSDTAVKCLPKAPYREMLKRLHDEILKKIADLEDQKNEIYQEMVTQRYEVSELRKVLSKSAEMLGFDFGGDLSFEIAPESFLQQVELLRDNSAKQ